MQGWYVKICIIVTSGRLAMISVLPGGQAHEALEGLAGEPGQAVRKRILRWLALMKAIRKDQLDIDKSICTPRNKFKRLFRRFKLFLRIYTRYDKLDMI